MRRFEIEPGGRLAGTCDIPGDKSISHRAIMLGAISEGRSRITGYLPGEDCLATRRAFEAMGVAISDDGDTLVIDGAGLHGLQPPERTIDLGNSGTGMRLLSGLLAGQRFDTRITGDSSLNRRPMGRIIQPLRQMGAQIAGDENDCAPLAVNGGQALRGIAYQSPVASAQIKSCVLLAGLYADGETTVHEPGISRDHSERMLAAFGAAIDTADQRVTVTGGPRLQARDVQVPSDLSSAAFFLIGAAIAPGSELTLPAVGVNPTRRGVIDLLIRMGADLRIDNEREVSGEPVADLTMRSSDLQAIDMDSDDVALAIDEFPALFVAAACAQGTTRLHGACELRLKETDRIAVMAEGLAALGVEVETFEDGLAVTGNVTGNTKAHAFTGGAVDSHGDHRVAMAFAMAALRARGPVTIHNCDNVDTSFPGFVDWARTAGLAIETAQEGS